MFYGVLLRSSIKGYGLVIDTSYISVQNKDCNCKNRKFNDFQDSILLKFNLFDSDICQLLCNKKVNYNYIDSLISQNDLPLKFSFLPLVNSRLNNHYSNGLGSIGLWELNYIYGLHNGLKMDSYIDERKDPVKSSIAAVKQLKNFHEKYKKTNWTLLAYWSSPSYINHVHQVAKSAVWDSCSVYIDQEYLDKLLLLNTVFRLDSLGVVEIKKPDLKTQTLDTVVLNQKISFNAIYDLTAIDLNVVQRNNPFLLKPYLPSNHPVLINHSEKEILENALKLIINYEDTLNITKVKTEYLKKTYTVEEGDYLGKIAIDKKVTVSEIMKWNKLTITTIFVGQQLVVYKEQALESSSIAFQKYVVKKGDQLWSIAQKFNGLTVRKILEHNNITELKEGTILKIVAK
jgi:membrane-bound lytic murein transglycosylase D